MATRTARTLARHLGAPAAAVYVVDGGEGDARLLRLHGHFGLTGEESGGAAQVFRIGEGLIGGAARSQDLVVVDRNPLENLKVLYGTGAVKLNDSTGQVERVGGVKYTIKDGIVYDAKKLLADVEAMVAKQKAAQGRAQQ